MGERTGSRAFQCSRTSIWRALFRGCWFPDAILHDKRSCRPRSRAVRDFSAAGLLSEAFQLASAGGCATGLQTKSRHAWNFVRVLTTGSGSATACDGAFARNHGSRLCSLKLLFFHSPAVSFLTSPVLEVFHGTCRVPGPSRCERSFCPPFGVFLWAVSI
jgi:hypothetical protein